MYVSRDFMELCLPFLLLFLFKFWSFQLTAFCFGIGNKFGILYFVPFFNYKNKRTMFRECNKPTRRPSEVIYSLETNSKLLETGLWKLPCICFRLERMAMLVNDTSPNDAGYQITNIIWTDYPKILVFECAYRPGCSLCKPIVIFSLLAPIPFALYFNAIKLFNT